MNSTNKILAGMAALHDEVLKNLRLLPFGRWGNINATISMAFPGDSVLTLVQVMRVESTMALKIYKETFDGIRATEAADGAGAT
jgi:hypothetical protein